MGKPARDPATYVGTKLALELIQTATFDKDRLRALAEGPAPSRDEIIDAAHRRLTKEMKIIEERRRRNADFHREHDRPDPDDAE